jgi:threonylcarbamoyladenosine tRNA methylthiotransferase MtaB
MTLPRTAALATLGCKTNQFESAALEEQLGAAGWTIVPFDAGAELVIVNTCTVTAATDSQSRNLIRRARRLNPDCRVVVTGCYAQVDPAALRALPGVSLVLGNAEKQDLLRLLGAEGGEKVHVSDLRQAGGSVPSLTSFAERSRAFVQIQNGCNAFCSYCIIPLARGPSRSVAPGLVLEQVQQLVDAGYPEVVLTGIHIGGYGLDLEPPTNLVTLIKRLLTSSSLHRLRLGSIEPTEIPAELIELLATSPILCPHLHIPLQAGNDAVLARMNRHYDTTFFRALIEDLVARIPDLAIGLDLIAGFPGESEIEFAHTLKLIQALPVTHLHVFPYSKRPGTPAALMPEQVAPAVIRERAAQLRALGIAKLDAFTRSFIGRELELVVEGGGKGGVLRGISRNYLSVRFAGAATLVGKAVTVRITVVDGQGAHGVLL